MTLTIQVECRKMKKSRRTRSSQSRTPPPGSHLPNRSSLVKSGKKEKARVCLKVRAEERRDAERRDSWRGARDSLYLPYLLVGSSSHRSCRMRRPRRWSERGSRCYGGQRQGPRGWRRGLEAGAGAYGAGGSGAGQQDRAGGGGGNGRRRGLWSWVWPCCQGRGYSWLITPPQAPSSLFLPRLRERTSRSRRLLLPSL